MAFLKNVFVENGYKENIIRKIIEEATSKSTQQNTKKTSSDCIDTEQKQAISLPWIPGVSPKLSKAYRKTGYKVVFKSNKNLQAILTSKNKSKLRKNSFPGVCKIPCSCGIIPYRGETKMKVSTRSMQHKTDIQRGRWENSGVAAHSKICNGEFQFKKTSIEKVS